jgi:hypothetical protein
MSPSKIELPICQGNSPTLLALEGAPRNGPFEIGYARIFFGYLLRGSFHIAS